MIAPLLNKGGRRQVYLPNGIWYDFWTGVKVQKTGWIEVKEGLHSMPVYVPAGAIIVYGPEQKYVDEKQTALLEIHIYSGADGNFKYKNREHKFDFMVKYENGKCEFDDGGCTIPYNLTIVGE